MAPDKPVPGFRVNKIDRFLAEGCEIVGEGLVAKGLVGSVVVGAADEGVDVGLEGVDAVGEIEAGVELLTL